MSIKYAYRNINIENPQTQPKKATTLLTVGMWLQFFVSGSTGFLQPLVGNTTLGTQNTSTQGAVEGLNMSPVPSTDASNDPITYDGIVDTTDRWIMPVVPTDIIAYGSLSGTFTAGELITGGTSGATARISTDNASNSMVINTITGTFVVGETITGGTSAATAVISTVGVNNLPNAVLFLGSKQNAGPDSISLDGAVAGTQFQVTKIIGGTTAFPQVEVRVLKDNN